MRQRKINQMILSLGFKEPIKVKKTNKKYRRVETLHSLDYSVKNSTRFTSKYKFKHIKILKFKIKAHRSIMREEGSGRIEKLSEIHKNIS